jgi:tRNA pseudouridine38-40 synthase
MKIALGIEYAGCNYYGWQKQSISPTIQETVESALSDIADEIINVYCAGRTDTGVHAIQQVIHFETSSVREPHSWIFGANSKLPKDISVIWALNVDDNFHARYAAENRTYQYLILNRRSRPAILNGLVTWERRQLDFKKMVEASKCLLGEHDFTSFRAVSCQANSPIRTVHELEINKMEDWFVITIRANGFLHHMIRNIAGVLIAVATGEEEVNWVVDVLDTKDRTVAGVTAVPDGLYLVNIEYPKHYLIPKPKKLVDNLKFNY